MRIERSEHRNRLIGASLMVVHAQRREWLENGAACVDAENGSTSSAGPVILLTLTTEYSVDSTTGLDASGRLTGAPVSQAWAFALGPHRDPGDAALGVPTGWSGPSPNSPSAHLHGQGPGPPGLQPQPSGSHVGFSCEDGPKGRVVDTSYGVKYNRVPETGPGWAR